MTAPVLSANDAAALDRALDVLQAGGLVAVPTETVYGLAADATDAAAAERIYTAKGRPGHNPLIAHVADVSMAMEYGDFDDVSARLAEALWPGPLTLVVPIKQPLAAPVHAGLPTVALRHPPGTMGLLASKLSRPLAAPSANLSGKLSPTTAQHVAEGLGERIDLILDAGPCATGLESTIVRCEPEAGRLRILRPGVIDAGRIAELARCDVVESDGRAVEAPGMMASHYAPRAFVRLDAVHPRTDEAMLGFGAVGGDLNLSASGDLEEAARHLYDYLARLDRMADSIAVAPIPAEGIGIAINDRLRRAAADRAV